MSDNGNVISLGNRRAFAGSAAVFDDNSVDMTFYMDKPMESGKALSWCEDLAKTMGMSVMHISSGPATHANITAGKFRISVDFPDRKLSIEEITAAKGFQHQCDKWLRYASVSLVGIAEKSAWRSIRHNNLGNVAAIGAAFDNPGFTPNINPELWFAQMQKFIGQLQHLQGPMGIGGPENRKNNESIEALKTFVQAAVARSNGKPTVEFTPQEIEQMTRFRDGLRHAALQMQTVSQGLDTMVREMTGAPSLDALKNTKPQTPGASGPAMP